MKKSYQVVIAVAVFLILIQFIRIDKSNPDYNVQDDFITISQPGPKIELLLKTACYDCHSYNTSYPWYSNVAPVSWVVKHHINEGREHLNFSVWGKYSEGKANHKLEECFEEVKENKMPLFSYELMHSEAELDHDQRNKLVNWFKAKLQTETID